MTPEEESIERDYMFLERLGMLCGSSEPSDRQIEEARRDADDHIKRLRQQ